ncbi:MAG: STAS domain-containing protein [Anaerolineae bacterium]
MELAARQYDGVRVVSGIEYLDAATSPEVSAFLDAELEAGHVKLVMDLSGVSYLSSAGLRVILSTLRGARSAGGDLRLAGAEGNIRRVLDVSGFSTFIETYPAIEEAAASYRT